MVFFLCLLYTLDADFSYIFYGLFCKYFFFSQILEAFAAQSCRNRKFFLDKVKKGVCGAIRPKKMKIKNSKFTRKKQNDEKKCNFTMEITFSIKWRFYSL